MSTAFELNSAVLAELARAVMPYGRYKGRPLLEIPEGYLVWMQGQGWPKGKLGSQLALTLEIKHNGLADLVRQAVAIER